jgi:hypothetical protein
MHDDVAPFDGIARQAERMKIDNRQAGDLRLAGPLGELAKAFGKRDPIRGDIRTACCLRLPGIRPRTGQRDLLAYYGPCANGPRRLGTARIRHEGQQRCKRCQPRGAPSEGHFQSHCGDPE